MADITLHRDNGFQKTVVPNYFIDAYMVHANGEYVKVYLYLLRCMNDPTMTFSISDVADKFEHTEKDIVRALKYWEKMHLLRLEFDENKELTGICFLDVASMPSPQAPAISMQTKKVSASDVPPRENYSAAELRRLKEEADIQELLFVAEHYLGHTLNTTEMNAILYWKESLNFSGDLIDYLIESCVAKGHKSVHYMEKVALSWSKAGISTVTAAKEEASRHNELHVAVKKAFGIQGRDFVPYEKEYINTWQKDYGFGTEIISAACERTIRAIHQVSFEYADSILKNWKKHNVVSPADIQALDALHQERAAASAPKHTENTGKRNRFNDFPQRSYDTSQLEKELLNYGTN
ncbi:MAG: DnaD domain protein [Lachnospiraceae bacterium]|nr:DnaD domain protein [Lachnospiraceae bacterium]MDD7178111.1 DnaD domain protein [bacterium]MDY5516863.1 DnaD domain protein [Lachnospiraceae bacterium]